MNFQQLALSSIAVLILTACGAKENSNLNEAPAKPIASASAPASSSPPVKAVNENSVGKTVFNKTCSMCHAAGVAGAPKPGDKADWQPRIAQGMEILYQHAIEGFSGAKGMMPARGGASSLSDEEMKAAVNFMVDQSR